MPFFKQRSIIWNFFGILGIFGISLVFIYLFTFSFSRTIIKNDIKRLVNAVGTLNEARINSWLSENEADLESFSKQEIVQNFAKGLGDRKTLEKFFDNFLKTKKNFFEIFLLDLDGNVFFSTNPEQEGKNKSNRFYFRLAKEKKQTITSGIYYSLTYQKSALIILTPIRYNGEILAYLAGRVELSTLDKILSGQTFLGQSGETYIVNTFNFIIGGIRNPAPEYFRKAYFTQGITAALDGRQGVSSYLNYKGERVIGDFRFLKKLNSALLTEIEEREAFKEINRLFVATISIILVFGLGIILLGLFFSYSIIKPIRLLTAAAQKIASGDFTTQIIIRQNNELRILGEAFNKMTNSLKKSRASLEEAKTVLEIKVAARTKEIRELAESLEEQVKERTKELQKRIVELEKFHKLTIGRELKMIELKKEIERLKKELKDVKKNN